MMPRDDGKSKCFTNIDNFEDSSMLQVWLRSDESTEYQESETMIEK
jgi:hypothetical protein